MDKVLILKKHINGDIEDALFPMDNPIEIGEFRYDAKRMGGAPTITASVNYPSCLDDEWTDNVYAEFNGEKYFLKQTPTSSYNNDSAMYKHDLTLVSERVALDNVYFFDVVTGDPMDSDKPVSNSTKVVFFGSVRDFASRLQASLEYSGLNYTVEVDEDDRIPNEEKLLSFEDQFFSNVLQEIYNTYEVPYYFEGRTIRIGYSNLNQDIPTFAYGIDDALISITKNNANYKIVNRATATGSSENIPFYYPNNSPKGVIKVASDSSAIFRLIDSNAFANEVGIGDVVTYKSSTVSSSVSVGISNDGNIFSDYNGGSVSIVNTNTQPVNKWFLYTFNVSKGGSVYVGGSITIDGADTRDITDFLTFAQINMGKQVEIKDGYIDCGVLPSGICNLKLGFSFPYLNKASYNISLSLNNSTGSEWYNETQKKTTTLSKMGLVIVSGQPRVGDTLTQELVEYINTSQVLLPRKYRETKGAERFYNATNYPFPFYEGYKLKSGEHLENGFVKNDTYYLWNDEYIRFNNTFIEGRPKEHIFTVEDIKPSIVGMEYNGVRIDMFEEFAYDKDDNDETYEDEEGNVYFKHPYFFAKLRPLGFNLFDHAIENQPMTISFTSGSCGACNFEIAVDEDSQKNTVQVNEDGDVIRDENGRILCGAEGSGQGLVEPQDIQQDTTNHSVWIALRKEEDTYGILMPKAPIGGLGEHRPSVRDTFVILGINLPEEYIIRAETKLEEEILKYLQNNNDEKFTFSIDFSRIYFAENESVLDSLNENSRITIIYNEKSYDLYVSSFSYSMSEGEPLPEIRIELDETLKTSQNALQNAISEVKSTLGNAINQVSYKISTQSRSYVSKVEDDTALGTVDFSKGIKFGEGGKVEILDNNSAKLTIEYLEVTKKASFTSLEIQEKTHVGGQILVTPAAINCGEVEEFDDYYRCYFQTKGEDGEEIFNQFAIGDQAICQTFNAWGSRYYWRLVVGIGSDYIDLSKTDYGDGSGIPQAGDKIIQMGNRSDASRQNAIVIAAYGDGSPYIIQYKGIDRFEIDDKMIVTKLSSTENIFTGKVHMELGSDGLENIGDFEVGGSNMLRNSGFTGDYLSAQLADEIVMDAVDEMFNPPLVHWDDKESPAVGATVQDSEVSASGKELVLANGHVTQKLSQRVISNESYVVSFKAKGKVLSEEMDEETGELVKEYTSLNVTFGGVNIEIALTEEWTYYTHKVVAQTTSDIFVMESSDVTICDLQLERGSIATAWGRSFLDNSSDRAYYQARKYLDDAIKGFTDVYGGLILTGLIKVGTQKDGVMTKETAGMNGQYLNDNDVAFWAGGSDTQAINAINQTGVDEASFAVSHGGKVVMNDAVVRGTVYASAGSFGGTVQMNFKQLTAGTTHVFSLSDSSSIWIPNNEAGITNTTLQLNDDDAFDGILLNVFCYPMQSQNDGPASVTGRILVPQKTEGINLYYASEIVFSMGGFAQFTYSKFTHEWILINIQSVGESFVEYE